MSTTAGTFMTAQEIVESSRRRHGGNDLQAVMLVTSIGGRPRLRSVWRADQGFCTDRTEQFDLRHYPSVAVTLFEPIVMSAKEHEARAVDAA